MRCAGSYVAAFFVVVFLLRVNEPSPAAALLKLRIFSLIINWSASTAIKGEGKKEYFPKTAMALEVVGIVSYKRLFLCL